MPLLARVWYRCRQFVGEINAQPLSQDAVTEIKLILSPVEWSMFERFSLSDQNHSFAVMKTLQADGCDDVVLLKAALLHDIGKTYVAVHVWDRVAIVMGKAVAPTQSKEWGLGEPAGWRRPFVIKEQHPAWGAQMAEEAGCSEALVKLILHHQDPPESILDTELSQTLRRLQWADDQH